MVLITDTPNGEEYNVLPAMYMNLGGGDPSFPNQKEEGYVGWVEMVGSRYTGEGETLKLPVRVKPLICTPICWKPLPEADPESKLRRRWGQLSRVGNLFRK